MPRASLTTVRSSRNWKETNGFHSWDVSQAGPTRHLSRMTEYKTSSACVPSTGSTCSSWHTVTRQLAAYSAKRPGQPSQYVAVNSFQGPASQQHRPPGLRLRTSSEAQSQTLNTARGSAVDMSPRTWTSKMVLTQLWALLTEVYAPAV